MASSAGERGGALGSQDSHSNGICTEEERNTNKRDQRHRAVFVESANIRVVSSVQNIVCYCCSFFPYFSILRHLKNSEERMD